jgi:hypothetical protein
MHGRETQAWYDGIAADSLRAKSIRQALARDSFLHVRVWNGSTWEKQGSIPEAGPECVKRQVVPLDLSRVTGGTVRIRLECVPNSWLVDCASIDYSTEEPIRAIEVAPESGLSRTGADVRRELAAVDGREYVIAPGDTADIAFRVPPIPRGRQRTYLARTTGWYHIETPETGEPQTALLDSLESMPQALARYSVERMNRAIAVLASTPDRDGGAR